MIQPGPAHCRDRARRRPPLPPAAPCPVLLGASTHLHGESHLPHVPPQHICPHFEGPAPTHRPRPPIPGPHAPPLTPPALAGDGPPRPADSTSSNTATGHGDSPWQVHPPPRFETRAFFFPLGPGTWSRATGLDHGGTVRDLGSRSSSPPTSGTGDPGRGSPLSVSFPPENGLTFPSSLASIERGRDGAGARVRQETRLAARLGRGPWSY